MSMKNPLTPAGIEPATFRFVAQHLNHCLHYLQNCTYTSTEDTINVKCILNLILTR